MAWGTKLVSKAPPPAPLEAEEERPQHQSPAKPQAQRSFAERHAATAPRQADDVVEYDLGLRAIRLVMDVGAHLGWSLEQINRTQSRARLDPASVSAELMPIYIDQVKPARAARQVTLQDHIRGNPDQSVFMMVKEGHHRLRVSDPVTAPHMAMLHGCTLESRPADRFAPPSELIKPKPVDPAKPAAPKP